MRARPRAMRAARAPRAPRSRPSLPALLLALAALAALAARARAQGECELPDFSAPGFGPETDETTRDPSRGRDHNEMLAELDDLRSRNSFLEPYYEWHKAVMAYVRTLRQVSQATLPAACAETQAARSHAEGCGVLTTGLMVLLG